MIHFIFATPFEAAQLLNDAEPISTNKMQVYRRGNTQIIICGVGLVQASSNVSLYLNSDLYKAGERVINFGIAGCLDNSCKLFSVHQVSSVECYDTIMHGDEMNPVFADNYPPFELSNEVGLKLMSSLHPVWRQDENTILKNCGADLVDMEGYAIAYACLQENISLEIYKSISDFTHRSSREEFITQAKIAITSLHNFIAKQQFH